MFTLRRITSENNQVNTALCESYNFIESERNPSEFKKSLEIMKWSNDEDVYGFISYNDGSKLIPLYKKSKYFIMFSNGETFDNISYK